MKRINYFSFVVAIIFVFLACGGGETTTQEPDIEEFLECIDTCQKACCLGCKATEGVAKCIILADGSMPCCY